MSWPSPFASLLSLALCATLISATHAQQAGDQPLMVLAGDGVRFVVLESEGDGGAMRGELRAGSKAYPLTGKFEEANGEEVLVGSCTINGKSIAFRGKPSLDDGNMEMSMGGKTYRLRPVETDSANAAGPAAKLDDDAKPVAAETTAPEATAVEAVAKATPEESAAAEPAKPAPAGAQVANQADRAGGLPDQLKLKLVKFPDVTMGNVTAATMLVPEGWQAQGVIEWRGTPTPYAQRNINVRSPDGCEMEFPFVANYQYLEYSQQAIEQARQLGMQPPEQRQGVAPPQDVGRWIGGFISQRPGAGNVRIVSAQRDRKSEQAYNDNITRAGGTVSMDTQSWVVRASYDQNGKPMAEEVSVLLQIGPPMQDQQFMSQIWIAMFEVAWRAPAEKFDAMRPLFQMIFRSLRADPRWYTQSMEIRTMMLRQQTQNMIDEIKRRAGEYNRQLTSAETAAARSKNNADDEAQRLRINAIAETSDFADKDGTRVNVPIHYKSVFGDGKGNYVLTNNSFQPGGEFTELSPWR